MHRVVVVGSSGSGKSTLASKLAQKLECPYLELDSIYHQSGWQPLPDAEFRSRVADFALQPTWVIDGNYTSIGTRELIWPVADTLVWLDLPRYVVMRRILARTLRRAFSRELLWNGNRERLSNLFRVDPEKNIVMWAWTRYHEARRRYESALAEPDTAHLRVVRIRTPGQADAFLSAIGEQVD